ncbi:MAG: hypothetical protein QM780_05725 [Hyphomicrobium sp.]|uniref:hypothetical protein n=1 Tax=Hyphomicrobium sp. TaxID=82 RepID=UPI0039E6A8AB
MARGPKEPKDLLHCAREGWKARQAQLRLSDNPQDDGEWNARAATIRACLKHAQTLPANNADDLFAKALLIAMLVEEKGPNDLHYRLAQNLIADLQAHGDGSQEPDR